MGTLYSTIKQLCEDRGIKGGKMCTDIGLSKGLLTDLKMGRRQGVSATTAQKIADYFGVSVAYLLTGEEDKKKPVSETGDELSALDLEILRRLSDLTPDERSKVDAFVQGLLANREA